MSFANNLGDHTAGWRISCDRCRSSIHPMDEQDLRMKTSQLRRAADRAGKIKYGLVAWLIGLPLPIIILAFFWGGCDF